MTLNILRRASTKNGTLFEFHFVFLHKELSISAVKSLAYYIHTSYGGVIHRILQTNKFYILYGYSTYIKLEHLYSDRIGLPFLEFIRADNNISPHIIHSFLRSTVVPESFVQNVIITLEGDNALETLNFLIGPLLKGEEKLFILKEL